MSDATSNEVTVPADGIDGLQTASTSDNLVGHETVTRYEGPEGEPAITAVEQARSYAAETRGKGASVLHLGSSAIGMNLNLNDSDREQLLRDIDQALQIVAARRGLEYVAPEI